MDPREMQKNGYTAQVSRRRLQTGAVVEVWFWMRSSRGGSR